MGSVRGAVRRLSGAGSRPQIAVPARSRHGYRAVTGTAIYIYIYIAVTARLSAVHTRKGGPERRAGKEGRKGLAFFPAPVEIGVEGPARLSPHPSDLAFARADDEPAREGPAVNTANAVKTVNE